MKRIIRLTESDLARIVRRVINEDTETTTMTPETVTDITMKDDVKLQEYASDAREGITAPNSLTITGKAGLKNGVGTVNFNITGSGLQGISKRQCKRTSEGFSMIESASVTFSQKSDIKYYAFSRFFTYDETTKSYVSDRGASLRSNITDGGTTFKNDKKLAELTLKYCKAVCGDDKNNCK
jgi:hypothetical protein